MSLSQAMWVDDLANPQYVMEKCQGILCNLYGKSNPMFLLQLIHHTALKLTLEWISFYIKIVHSANSLKSM